MLLAAPPSLYNLEKKDISMTQEGTLQRCNSVNNEQGCRPRYPRYARRSSSKPPGGRARFTPLFVEDANGALVNFKNKRRLGWGNHWYGMQARRLGLVSEGKAKSILLVGVRKKGGIEVGRPCVLRKKSCCVSDSSVILSLNAPR